MCIRDRRRVHGDIIIIINKMKAALVLLPFLVCAFATSGSSNGTDGSNVIELGNYTNKTDGKLMLYSPVIRSMFNAPLAKFRVHVLRLRIQLSDPTLGNLTLQFNETKANWTFWSQLNGYYLTINTCSKTAKALAAAMETVFSKSRYAWIEHDHNVTQIRINAPRTPVEIKTLKGEGKSWSYTVQPRTGKVFNIEFDLDQAIDLSPWGEFAINSKDPRPFRPANPSGQVHLVACQLK
eukprot:TRINITY_DN31933_c0_g1_i1.p1 TRINITY_DN31933_c0_g1~~TRINITY_DN31933_c0_g1_i1.p1  ORF type:complete len:237 (-),score=59.70 TRINITY_DN31933_c0_g1_i1:406-1116(-)